MTKLQQAGGRKDTQKIRLPNGKTLYIKDGIIELDRPGSVPFLLSRRAEKRYGFNFVKWESIPVIEKKPAKAIEIENKALPSIAYVTAITGGKDSYRSPHSLDENVDYYYFTDDPKAKSKQGTIVKQIPEESYFMDDIKKSVSLLAPKDRKTAKNLLIALKIRILSANLDLLDKRYDIVVWHDGSITPKKVPYHLFQYMLDGDMVLALYGHSQRSCIFDEIEEWNKQKMYFKKARDRTLKRYEDMSFPVKYGLWTGGVHVQNRMNPDTRHCMDFVWSDIVEITISDQLTYSFIAHRHKYPIMTIGRQFGKEYNKAFSGRRGHLK